MKKVLTFAAAAEAATGVALLVVRRSSGSYCWARTSPASPLPVARVTGIALIGLGVACWPGPPLWEC